MIQRLHTLWLLLAAIFAFLSYQLPFYSGTRIIKDTTESINLDAGKDIYLLLLTGAVILLTLAAIFLYKNRKTQLTNTIIDLILSVVLLIVYFLEIKKFQSGTIALWCLLVFAIPLFLFLAARGISKDEKLIKSLDRLR